MRLEYLEITITCLKVCMMLTIFIMDHEKDQTRVALASYLLFILYLCDDTL